MLTITYSHALADPTYCDEGKEGGLLLLKRFNKQGNEPVPLIDIFPYVTLREAVWCLRVCKHSQQTEARIVTWSFVSFCLGMFPALQDEYLEKYITVRKDGKAYSDTARNIMCIHYAEYAKGYNDLYKIPKIITSDEHPSQMAINLIHEVIRQGAIYYPDRNIEQELRIYFKELIK